MKIVKYLTVLAVFSLISYLVVVNCLFRYVIVSGDSMVPSFRDSQLLSLNTHAYLFHNPTAGDVVVFKDPVTETYSVKRVIATSGDSIAISNSTGKVYVNGKELIEPYICNPKTTFTYHSGYTNLCRNGEFFLMGDNRMSSADSREYGPVSKKRILGRIEP